MIFSESGFHWFRRGITLVLIVICNLILLSALWVSGLDLDFVLTNAELYDPQGGHCVRVALGRGVRDGGSGSGVLGMVGHDRSDRASAFPQSRGAFSHGW